jgi:DNA-binding transcriptional LysR family regulator
MDMPATTERFAHDAYTLDQLRTLLLVAEEGSFSAAARRLQRVQSAVSQSMRSLEEHLGVSIFDRRERTPVLTDEGRAVLEAARRVCAEADALGQLVDGMHRGLEARVHLCVDALFPLASLAELCAVFAKEMPTVDLRVDTQTMSAVSARVLEGKASLGVAVSSGLLAGLVRHELASIRMVPVVAPTHPLAQHLAGRPKVRGVVPRVRLEEAVQIVLTEREPAREGLDDQAVLSTRTWRIAELHTKRELLLAGLGWGNLPEHVAREDLRRGTLVRLRPEGWAEGEHTLGLFAVHRRDARLGPAHRWLLANLASLCAKGLAPDPRAGAAPSGDERRQRHR